MTVRIVVADDHAVVRAGLAALISAIDGFVLVGEADSGPSAVRAAVSLRPDVLLLDIQMPGGGIEAAREVARTAPLVRVLMVTMFEDEPSIRQAIAAGALGYVLKGADPEEIVRAITGVAAGGAVFGTGVARTALGGLSGPAEPRPPALPELSDRERHVLGLMAEGMSNSAIAERLGLSPHTVSNHISNIFRKLGVAMRAEAIVMAIKAGLGGRPGGVAAPLG